MRDIITDLQGFDTWKIQLTIGINFISSKMLNNTKFTSYNDANEVVNEPFESLRSRYQGNLEKLMRWSEFIFDSVLLMYNKCHKVNFRRGGSYIDPPDWILGN